MENRETAESQGKKLFDTRKIADLVKSDKGRRILIIVAAAGILLILLSEFIPSKSKSAEAPVLVAQLTEDQYIEKIESELKDILEKIEGVGEVELMITLEKGTEQVFATEGKSTVDRTSDDTANSGTRTTERSNSEEKLIILSETGGGQKPLVKTELQPQVKGVVVVCGGADKTVVEQRIIDTVTTALRIGSNRVCVAKHE